jgi:tetratricopeptide (TPR) repeat protein
VVGDDKLKTYASLLLRLLDLKSGSSLTLEDALAAAQRAFQELEGAKAGTYTYRVQATLASMYLSAGQAARSEQLLLPLVSREKDQRTRLLYVALRILLAAWAWGPRAVGEAIPRCEALLSEEPPLRVEASAYRYLAVLRAMQADFKLARLYVRRDQEILEELGLRAAAAGMRAFHGVVELLAGEPEEAERTLRVALATLKSLSEQWYIGSIAALLGQALYAQGRMQEAWDIINFSDEISARDAAVGIWNAATRGKILASQGEYRAVAMAQRAVDLSENTDHMNERASAWLDLGTVMVLLGKRRDAAGAYARAASLYSRKGNAVMASRAHVLRSEVAS